MKRALVLLAALVLTGCSGGSPAAAPSDAFAAATAALRAGDYAFTFDGVDGSGSGVTHRPSRSAGLRVDRETTPTRFEYRWVGPDTYTRSGTEAALKLSVPWLHRKTGQEHDGDLTELATMLDQVRTANPDGHDVAGAMNAKLLAGSLLWDADVKQMGSAGNNVPYRATLDGQGRLTQLVALVPGGSWVVKVTGYGTQKAQPKPAGPVKEGP